MRCCCLLNTWKGSTVNKCNMCFYALMDKDLEAPCITCTGYSNYVKGDMYMTPSHAAQPLKEAIDDWFAKTNGVSPTDFLYNPVLDYDTVNNPNSTNGVASEDFWVSYKGAFPDPKYNVVEKPKHYMLFEEQGIEVRDVIDKLVNKMWSAPMPTKGGAMQYSDYVQMMQYLMRFMDKNGVEDLKKARWYLDKLIGAYDESDF